MSVSVFRQPVARYIAFMSTVFLVAVHYINMRHEYEAARTYFVRTATADAERAARKVEATFYSINRNLGTIAQLPGVIASDRRGLNIDLASRQSIGQIYNNLSHTIAISQIHIVPADFDGARIDPETGMTDRPTLTYTNLQRPTAGISNGPASADTSSDRSNNHGPASNGVRSAEYKQLREHLKWLKENYSTSGAINTSRIPMIGGAALTSSGTSSGIAGLAGEEDLKDRTGLIFSVPFFGTDGAIKGSVSAVVPGREVRKLLPPQNYALLDTTHSHVFLAQERGQERRSAYWVRAGVPDPNLVASTVLDVRTHDPRSTWRLWAGLPNSVFHNSPSVNTIWLFEFGGYAGLILLMTLLLFIQWLENARAKVKRVTEEADRIKQAHANAQEAEREARRLNEELEANMKMLSEAQKELVKHERLAALGQVTATLSHEIRNPLGAIRSSLYVMRRTAEKANIKMDRPLDRIERSVTRCDNLIDDFLEYTRTQKLSIQTVDASDFLNELLEEQTLPDGISLTRDLPVQGSEIAVDPDRFRRVIINLVENAAQAITEKGDTGGEINVSCRDDEDGSVIRVRDNGPGIPEDVLGKVFEPLFTTKSFGAGLGLATVKQLVDQHDAELKIDTECGVGSTFSVFLRHPAAVTTINHEPNIEEMAA
ncbi:MAG: sensor histidine kinase [Hyphomicrobiaceae bacterium]